MLKRTIETTLTKDPRSCSDARVRKTAQIKILAHGYDTYEHASQRNLLRNRSIQLIDVWQRQDQECNIGHDVDHRACNPD